MATRENAIWRHGVLIADNSYFSKMTGCLIPSLCAIKVGGHAVIKDFLRIPFSLSSALRRLYKTRGIRLKASTIDPPRCLAFMCEKSTDNSAVDLIWAIYSTQTPPRCIPELCLAMQLGQLVPDPFRQQNLSWAKETFLEIWHRVCAGPIWIQHIYQSCFQKVVHNLHRTLLSLGKGTGGCMCVCVCVVSRTCLHVFDERAAWQSSTDLMLIIEFAAVLSPRAPSQEKPECVSVCTCMQWQHTSNSAADHPFILFSCSKFCFTPVLHHGKLRLN